MNIFICLNYCFYKRIGKYLVNNLNYFRINACNLFSICYLCFIGSEHASKPRIVVPI
jgi:hypothetical protein